MTHKIVFELIGLLFIALGLTFFYYTEKAYDEQRPTECEFQVLNAYLESKGKLDYLMSTEEQKFIKLLNDGEATVETALVQACNIKTPFAKAVDAAYNILNELEERIMK